MSRSKTEVPQTFNAGRPARALLIRWALALGLMVLGSGHHPAGAAETLILRQSLTPEQIDTARRAFEQRRDNYFLRKFFEESVDLLPEVWVAEADVNDDGTPEIFLLIDHIYFCGTGGCDLWIIQRGSSGPRIIGEGSGFSGVKIRILDRKDEGYRRICSLYALRWNGRQYHETTVRCR